MMNHINNFFDNSTVGYSNRNWNQTPVIPNYTKTISFTEMPNRLL